MPLKDVLVHTDNSGNSTVRLEYATRLAEVHDANLTGLYVAATPNKGVRSYGQTPNYIVPDLGGRSLKEYDEKAHSLQEEHHEHAKLASERAHSRFEAATAARKISHNWVHTEGSMSDALTHHARFCDVAIVGQPGPESQRHFGETPTDHLILSVGHPVLIVPNLADDFTVGKRIMVAWDRSPLATRAVHNSRPLLRNADSVHILAINLASEDHGNVPGSGICEHLAHHDIKASPVHVDSGSETLSKIMLSKAKELDIDLIIMGAYGHSRLREKILGGNTYHLLNNSPIPLLMNH
jgi:nucleotide-binding universal stress UspA family protein